MEKDNLFDGIDLSELAGSESPIIKEEQLETKETVSVTTEDSTGKENSVEEDVDSLVGEISLEDIANIGGNEEDLDKDLEDGEADEIISKAPAQSDEASPTSNEESTLTFLASALQEAGVFSSLEEEDLENIVDADSLISAVEKQIKSNELADLTEDQKEYITALRSGVPHADYAQRKYNTAEYESISDEIISEEGKDQLRAELIKRSFLIKGFDEKTSKEYALLALQSPDAVDKAIAAKNALVAQGKKAMQDEIDNKAAELQNRRKKEEDLLSSLKSKVNETSEIIPGIKVNSRTKDKIFSSMTVPVKVNETGDPLNEVMDEYATNSEYKLKVHALHILTNGFTDFSKISKSSKSKAVKELDAKLKSNTSSGGSGRVRSSNKVTTGQTSRDIAESLRKINLKNNS